MIRKFITSLASVIVLVTFTHPLYAADLDILCTTTCAIQGNNQLFSEANVIPGESISRTLEVTNNNGENLNFEVQFAGSSTPPNFSEEISAQVINGSDTIFNGTLDDLLNTSLNLGTIPNSSTETYEFTLSLPISAGNEFQNATSNFDISFSFETTSGDTLDQSNNSNADINSGSSSDTNADNSSSGQVLGISTDNTIIGQVLGLSNTSGGKLSLLIGVELILFGLVFILRYRKKKNSSNV